MPVIKLITPVQAPATRCFDLSLSIDLHIISTSHTGERAIAGTTTGLIGLGETVTWRARHFGVWQKLTTKITAYDRPRFFVDEMVKGAFKRFRHEHYFLENGEGITTITDVFDYQSPLGRLGRIADGLFLKRYMTNLLEERNQVIKQYAETEQWRRLLPH